MVSRFLLLCRFYFNVYRIITIIILLLYFIVTFNIFILCFLRINVLVSLVVWWFTNLLYIFVFSQLISRPSYVASSFIT